MTAPTLTVYGHPRGTAYETSYKGGIRLTKRPREWKSLVRTEAWAANPTGEVLISEGPISLSFVAYLPRPKSMTWKTRPMPATPHTKKPDTANLLKLAEDALKGIWWKDDGQVCAYHRLEKFYAAGEGYGDPRPRIEIAARPLAEGGTDAEPNPT